MSTATDLIIGPELNLALIKSAFMAVGEAIISINSNSIIVMANPEAEKIFGYESDELVGQHLHILMPEQHWAAHSAGIARYLQTGIAHVLGLRLELSGVKKNGLVFPIEIRITSNLVDNQRFFTATLRDITLTKEREGLLDQQRAQLTEQSQQLARIYYFLKFTLENMEMTLRQGADYRELLVYIEQVKKEANKLERELRR